MAIISLPWFSFILGESAVSIAVTGNRSYFTVRILVDIKCAGYIVYPEE